MLKQGYELEEEADVCDALEQTGDLLKHGMVPDDMVPKACPLKSITEGKEGEEEELPPLMGLKNSSLNQVD